MPHPGRSHSLDRRFAHRGRVAGPLLWWAAELSAWRKAHRWRPNQLRHTVATEVRARFGLKASQTVLGHARADVTQVYAERDLTRAHEVMREIG